MAKGLAEFAPLPVAALLDARLTSRDFRVLAAICAHDPKRRGEPVPIVRKNIAALARVNEAQVSRSSASLASFGWITKAGDGGRSRPVDYVVHWRFVPETVSELVRVLNSETVLNLSRVSALETVPNSGTVSDERVLNSDTLSKTVPNSDTVSAERVLSSSTVSAETVLNSDTVSREKGAQIEQGQLINHCDVSNTESTDDDSRAIGDQLKTVYGWMQQYGMRPPAELKQRERSQMMGWVGKYTPDEILAAIKRADEYRSNKPAPLSPSYVNTILLNGDANKSSTGGRGQKKSRPTEDLHGKDYDADIG